MAASKTSASSGPSENRKTAVISLVVPAGRPTVKISTVSHTLHSSVAEQLRQFAFRERISESAVIEFALRTFFGSGVESDLGQRLRDAGAALRRKS